MTRPRSFARRTVVATALLCAPLLVPAQGGPGMPGQPGNRLVNLVISGGMTVPTGEFKTLHDNGFHIDGSLIFNIPGLPVAFRPELSLTSFRFKQSVLPSPDPSEVNKTQAISGLGNIEVPLSGGFYVLGGIGAMNLQTKLAQDTTSNPSATNLFIDAGVGVRFAIRRVSGFFEARVGTASYEKGKFGYSKAQFVPLTFGLVF
ncbi:MAG: hypothetical protein H7Z40_03890 [Phycisphaerae bacterium]|nr:hypothetical protein [Gemmatimonadaceae bacterium]